LSSSLLQNARSQTRFHTFGNPDENVMYDHALVEEMKSRGHDILVVEKKSSQLYKMLEAMILAEEIYKRKSVGDKMMKQDKLAS